MPRSRRLTKEITGGGELPEGYGYCRKCKRVLKHYDFYSAIDGDDLDSSGYMSICKGCINEMYVSSLNAESGSIEKAILRLCRKLNWKFSQEAIDAAMRQIESSKGDPLKIAGFYKAKLKVIFRTSPTDNNLDLTYQHEQPITLEGGHTLENYDPNAIDQEVIEYWGEGLETKDYQWLEKQLDNWKRTHKSDTYAEQMLLREIVFKQFEIEKARKAGDSTASAVKELQDIIKTAALDPAKTLAANSSKANDAFSSFIKMIEENEPAEVYADKELFKDFDNIGEKYFIPYIVRPLKNFITGSRDFNVEGEDAEDEDEFLENTTGDGVETEE